MNQLIVLLTDTLKNVDSTLNEYWQEKPEEHCQCHIFHRNSKMTVNSCLLWAKLATMADWTTFLAEI